MATKAANNIAVKKYNQTEKGRATQRRRDTKRRKDFPEKIKAHSGVSNALRDGILSKKPCPCGEIEVEGHHEDYSKPLEVDWLCTKCHIKAHRKERDGII